jgi:hypothetical protein
MTEIRAVSDAAAVFPADAHHNSVFSEACGRHSAVPTTTG